MLQLEVVSAREIRSVVQVNKRCVINFIADVRHAKFALQLRGKIRDTKKKDIVTANTQIQVAGVKSEFLQTARSVHRLRSTFKQNV